METAATAQHKRLYYRPAGRPSPHQPKSSGGFRSKVSFSQPHLLQRLVYVESEVYERLNEQAGDRAAADVEEMLIRYVKHLVRIAIRRNSFYVTPARSAACSTATPLPRPWKSTTPSFKTPSA